MKNMFQYLINGDESTFRVDPVQVYIQFCSELADWLCY